MAHGIPAKFRFCVWAWAVPALLGALLGCAAEKGDPRREVIFWNLFTAGGPSRAIDDLVDRFNRTNPDFRVTKLDVPDINQKLLTATAGRVPPDVSMFDRFRVAAYASRDAFALLDPLIERDRIRAADFFDPCWLESQYEGKMYAMPFNTDVRVLFYNRAIFREAGLDPNRPPKTWRELEEYAEILTRKAEDGSFLRVGFVPIWGNTWLYLYGWQKGGEFISGDGRTITCNAAPIVAALDWVTAFTSRFGLQALKTFASEFGAQEQNPFFTGKIAMQGDEGFLMSLIKQYAPDLDYDVAPLPWPEDGIHATWSGGFCLVLPRGAKNPEGAWEFMKFMCSREPQLHYGKTAEQLPANRTATSDPYFTDDAKWRLFVEEMEFSRFRPISPAGSLLWDELARATDLAVHEKMSPRQALNECQRRVQEFLNDFYVRHEHPLVNWRLALGIVIPVIGAAVLAKVVHSAFQVRRSRLLRREHVSGYLFTLPWVIGFGLFTLGPVVASVFYSFCNYEVLTPARWLGLYNYGKLVTNDPLFWKSLWNTIYYTIFAVPLGLVGGLALAMLLNQKVRFLSAWRSVYFLPSIVPVVAASVLWIWVFNPKFGLLNWGLREIGITGFLAQHGIGEPAWLTSEHWSKPSLILMSLWGMGGGMVIYLAGLQGIPQQLYEAARIDGAGPWQQFRHVTVPLLSPTIFFNLIMGIIGSFQVFTQAYIMTGGGPVDSTLFYVFYLFQNAFAYFTMGYASAMAWILFLIILALTVAQFRLARRWVYYEGLQR